MLVYKNFDVVPGISSDLKFEVLDDTFLKVDLTGYSYKLEVFNSDRTLKFVANDGFTSTLGAASKVLSDTETLSLGSGLFQYRLVIKNGSGVSSQVCKGFLACAEPVYVESSDTSSSATVLPDGSIYLYQSAGITLGMWYSIHEFQRLMVSGVGRVGLDLRNNIGAVQISSEVYNNTTGDESQWIPYVGQSTSFRVNQIFGANTVRLLF